MIGKPGRVVQVVTKTVQGEGSQQGLYPASIIRFSGCPVACSFCDTRELLESDEALCVNPLKLAPNLIVTGGEPLLRENVEEMEKLGLFSRTWERVWVETSFAVPAEKEIVRVLLGFRASERKTFAVSPKIFNAGQWRAVQRNLRAVESMVCVARAVDLKLLAPWQFEEQVSYLDVAELFLTKLGELCRLIVMPITDKFGGILDRNTVFEMAEKLYKAFKQPVFISPRLHFVLGVE